MFLYFKTEPVNISWIFNLIYRIILIFDYMIVSFYLPGYMRPGR
jgi:hypothetical protein